jgi:hypothetical protein
MNQRQENQKCIVDIADSMETMLRVIQDACAKMIKNCENLRVAATIDAQLSRTVDPLKAPEVTGADKDGDGGEPYTPRIDLDD